MSNKGCFTWLAFAPRIIQRRREVAALGLSISNRCFSFPCNCATADFCPGLLFKCFSCRCMPYLHCSLLPVASAANASLCALPRLRTLAKCCPSKIGTHRILNAVVMCAAHAYLCLQKDPASDFIARAHLCLQETNPAFEVHYPCIPVPVENEPCI
eukprot:83316-Pelagomonas_calceolata.AAC.12